MLAYRRKETGQSGQAQGSGKGGSGKRRKAAVAFPFGWQETFKLLQLILKRQPWGYSLPPDAFLLGAKGATHHFDQRRSVDIADYKMYESFRNRSQPWLPAKAMT